MEDWLGTTRIVNDALGRAERIVYPDGKEVCYTYGKLGERRSLTYPDGRTVYYGFDGNMRLSELKDGDKIISYEYDGAGRLSKKVFPNGTQSAYTYDRRSRITGLIHTDGSPSWSDINSGVKRLAKKGAKWYEKNKEDIWKLGVTAVGVGIAVGVTAATLGTGAAVFVGVSAAAGATTGGMSAKITGGNVVNNICGGAVNGTVTAVGTVAGIPGVGNFAGGFAGSLTVDILEEEDNIPDILKRALISGAVQSGMSMGGAVTKAGYDVGLKNLSAEGIYLNYVNMVYGTGTGVAAYGFQKALKSCPE